MAACALAAPRAPLPRRARPRRLSCAASATFGSQGEARGAAPAAAPGCPYTAARAAFAPLLQPAERHAAPQGRGAAQGPGDAFTYLADLSFLALKGIEEATLRFATRYGAVCRFPNPARLGGAAAWTFVASPEGIEHACATRAANYAQRFLPDAYAYATRGLGVLGSQGSYNRAQRRLCGAPFLAGAASAAPFAAAAVAAAERLGDAWEEGMPGAVVDVAQHAQKLTLDVIGTVAFSYDFQQVASIRAAQPRDALLGHINSAQAIMGALFITPMPVLRALSALRAPQMATLDAALAGMHAEVAPVIAARRAQHAAGAPAALAHRDLLDALLAAGLSDEEVWEDVHDVLGAGHETTATALAAALHALAAQPALAAELDRQLDAAAPAGRPLTAADVSSGALWYATALVKEALRLYPPIPLFPRVAAGPDTLPDGTCVAAGEVIFMSAYAMGRLPSLWAADGVDADDALRFDPLRFTPAAEAARHRFAFVPFGAGPRMCLGASFALTSAALMLATLARRFTFQLPEGGAAPPPERHADRLLPAAYDITLHFPRGVPLRVVPRRGGCAVRMAR